MYHRCECSKIAHIVCLHWFHNIFDHQSNLIPATYHIIIYNPATALLAVTYDRIERVLDNVDSKLIDATFILLILKEQEDKNGLIEQLTPLKPNMKFVIVNEVTEGAACTALLAKEHVNNDVPLFIANSDQFVQWDVDAFWRDRLEANGKGVDGDVLCFHVPMENNDTKCKFCLVICIYV